MSTDDHKSATDRLWRYATVLGFAFGGIVMLVVVIVVSRSVSGSA